MYATICLTALTEAARKFVATVHAYCIMPDHVHALAEIGEGTRLTELARLFKQLSGYRLKRRIGSEVWQISYYDHILRSDEDILDVARYIWENPVEDGLVAEYIDYRLSGPRETMTALQTR